MDKKDHELIAAAIWRAGYIKDDSKVKQQAKEDARRLVATNIATDLEQENKEFDRDNFMKMCGF